MALSHDIATNSDKLVEHGASPEEAMVRDDGMTTESAAVGHGIEVPDDAVVPEVAADHEHIVVSQDGLPAFGGAAMDGAMFADHTAVADAHSAGYGLVEATNLRGTADDGTRTDLAICADLCSFENLCSGGDAAAFGDDNSFFNDCEGTDHYGGMDGGLGRDQRGGMSGHGEFGRGWIWLKDTRPRGS